MTAQPIPHYSNLKRKSRFVELFPFLGGGTSTAIYPNVYLSRAVYDNFYSATPDPYLASIVLHEEEHIKRIAALGRARWYWRYITSTSFRIDEELAADIPQFKYLKVHGLKLDLERQARVLSGRLYLWAVSYNRALERITKIWEEA